MKKILRFLIISITLLIFISGKPRQAMAYEYWDRKVSLFDSLKVYPEDIVFLGNSITDGGEFQELFQMDNIKNRGISSDVIDGVLKRLHQVTDGKPKKIFLLIGINDVSHNLSASTLVKKYEVLVDSILKQTPETHLYLQSVMPINNDFKRYKNLTGKENVILEFNKGIKQIAETRNQTYIDLWPYLSDKNGKLIKSYTNDGLHLSGAGYKVWTAAIDSFVRE